MRIAIVAPPWGPIPPDRYGGIEQAVDGLARGLQEAGHEILLYATGDSTCPVPLRWLLEEAEGNRMGFTVPELRHVMAAYDTIAESEIDIVHDHTVLGPVYAEGYTDLPVVTTVHGPFNEELIDLYGRVAHRVPLIGISEAQGRAAPQVPIARVIAGARMAGLPIKLAGKCREPWEHRFFDAEIAPLLGDGVEYMGEVDQAEKVALLGGACVTLFPIRWNEPFGLVMIESMACGTPVLAFHEGAAPEVVADGETGYLCRDESEMVEKVKHIGDIDRAVCRAAVEGYFSRERMIGEHVEFYEEILSRHKG